MGTTRVRARDGTWEKHSIFRYSILDEDGTGGYLVTDQNKTVKPSLYVRGSENVGGKIKSGIINRIHYRLNPTNSVTYTLRLWDATEGDDYHSNVHMIYESPSTQADDTDYDRCELEIPFSLDKRNNMYYSIDWSAAPDTTTGFISVAGIVVE